MPVDLYASESHYLRHLAATWAALGDDRGDAWVPYGLLGRAAAEGLPAREEGPRQGPPAGDRPCLVASYKDHRLARAAGRPVVYVEHGAGQSYPGSPEAAAFPGYSGGRDHDGTVLFLTPGEEPAARWRAAYPAIPAVPVGCPKLDARHLRPVRARARTLAGATVAVSFHFDCALVQETRSAWRHWEPSLRPVVAALRDAGAHVLGHAHPRLWRHAEPVWRRAGAEPVAELDEVLDRADVFAADNTSALPEAASCGVPLVWVDHPHYRRDVWHGGRFWAWPAGQVSCGEPSLLPSAFVEALADAPEVRASRQAMLDSIYLACDGRAAERAAAAIRKRYSAL